MDTNTTFIYHYSAPENKEVQEIRRKYLPKRESKFEELIRLDHDAQIAGTIEGLAAGIAGCVMLGLGVCFSVRIIGSSLLLGVFADITGVAAMIAAFPIYRHISGKAKARLAPKILQLADELSSEQGYTI